MEILVAYDVATDDVAGKRRLRRVAKVCLGYAQRLRKSVFECIVIEAGLEMLKHRLSREMEGSKDSVRIYRLIKPRNDYLCLIDKQPRFDLQDPLLVCPREPQAIGNWREVRARESAVLSLESGEMRFGLAGPRSREPCFVGVGPDSTICGVAVDQMIG